MAVVSQNQADQENQNGTTQSQTSGGNGAGVTTVVSGSKGGSGGGSSNAAPTVQNAQGSQNSASNTPSTSGSFTNLKSYLNANNGGQQFTQQINNNLNQQGQQIQSNVNNASQQFNQQAQQVVNPVQQNYNNFQQNGGATGDANAITSYAKANNDNASSIRNLENASYTGPKSLNDLSGQNNGAALQSNIQNYSTLANNAQTEPGRFSLLQNMFGGQGYNQGQQTLDNLFIDPSKLTASRASANQAQNAYTQAANNATNQAQNYQNQLQGYAQGTVSGLGNAVNNQYQNVQNETQQDIANQQNAVNNFLSNYKAGKINQADATALGINNGDATYNLDPTQYITQGTTPTAQAVASQQDYANFAALQGLLGSNANSQTAATLAQFQDPSKSGQLGPAYNLDQSGYQAALASAKDAYQQAVNPVQQDLNTLNSGYQNSPYTYQGTSGNGWLGAMNDMASALRASGFAQNSGAIGASNEDLVKLAEQNNALYNGANGPTPQGGPVGAIDDSKYFTPYYQQDLQKFGIQGTNNPGNPNNMAFTDLVDAYQNKISAQQQALKNLANQYGANNTLNIG